MIEPQNRFGALALVGAAIFVAGCGPRTEQSRYDPERTTPSTAEQELPGNESPSDVTALTARVRVSDLRVGSALDAEGAVAENVDEIARGEAVLASVAVGDVGAGSQLKAVWLAEDDTKLAEQVASVEPGKSHLVFRGPDTATWAAGDYEVEIYLGDELAASEQFELVERGG